MVRQTISWTKCFQWDKQPNTIRWRVKERDKNECRTFFCVFMSSAIGVAYSIYIVNTFTFICLWKVKYKRCMPSIDPYKIPSFNLLPSFGAQWENKRNNQSTAHRECANSSILNAINLFGLILGWHAIYMAKMRDDTKKKLLKTDKNSNKNSSKMRISTKKTCKQILSHVYSFLTH